ncbi:MAG: aspartyl-phosphate phosphatase Spo0E family protein [Syntrophomonas sp.]
MDIIQSIERLRAKLVEKGMEKGFQDPQVIELSQKLDDLINKYYRLGQELNKQVPC